MKGAGTVARIDSFGLRKRVSYLKYHCFRSFVADESIVINPIDTSEQLVDIEEATYGLVILVCYVRLSYYVSSFRGSVRIQESN